MEEKEKQMDELVDDAETRMRNEQMMEAKSVKNEAPIMGEELVPLFEEDRAERFRSHWLDIQARFVDDPRESVKKADELVEDVIKTIAEGFSQKRNLLEDQWNSGDNVSTEDLRLAIKRYRSFFDRLLSLES